MSRVVRKKTVLVKGERVVVRWRTLVAGGRSTAYVSDGFVTTVERSDGINNYAVEVVDGDRTKTYVESFFEPHVKTFSSNPECNVLRAQEKNCV